MSEPERSDGDKALASLQAEWQKNPDSHNGAVRERYRWSQTIADLDVRVPVPSHVVRGKQVICDVRRQHLLVRVASPSNADASGWATLVDADLTWPVKHVDATWTLHGGGFVHISLEKDQERWWDALVVGEPKISLRNIECVRDYEDLDDEARQKINQLKFDDQQKRLGLPTSNELQMQDIMAKAWNQPGSPFAGQPFDASKIHFSGNNMSIDP